MQQQEVCDGVSVPAPLAGLFRQSGAHREKSPFSYSKPTPGIDFHLHSRIAVPKVCPLVPEMPQPVHLQYNSPMGLYSKESAVEQFTQQIGPANGVALPAADKHFDPSKSATLKYLREGENNNFGQNFEDQIARAEAPNVPNNQEPGWARYAREKSERARSKTPAAHEGGYYTPSSTPAPLCHPVHHDTYREHQDKTKTYTNAVHPANGGPAYYQVASPGSRRRNYSEGAKHDRGYELGGIDYTKGLNFQDDSAGYYYQPAPRREQRSASRPGYECGGTDFGHGHISSGPYHGHGPDPPRLRPHYSADPRSACNAFVAPNVEQVDANLLVGDTYSNQKIRHEVRNIDQSEFGTSFAPPTGFKRDHITVRRAPSAPEPVTFCVSAPNTVGYKSSAPADQQNVWRDRQAQVDREVITIKGLLDDTAIRPPPRPSPQPSWTCHSQRKHDSWRGRGDPRDYRREVYVTEPNWSRNVNQRRGAWERKAHETEHYLNRPASQKVAPDAPPAWHGRAERAHNVWQNAADQMNSQQQYQGHYEQQTHQSNQQTYQQPPQQQQFQNYSEQRHETHSSSQPPLSSNAQQLINTGYNQNQVDYILQNQDKYDASKSSKFTTTSTRTENVHNVPVGYTKTTTTTSTSQNQPSGNYSTETHITRGANSNNQQQQQFQSHLPVSSAGQNFHQDVSRHESHSLLAPLAPIDTSNSFESHYEKSVTSSSNQQPIALPAPAPVSPATSYKSFSSSHYSKQEKTTSQSNGGGFPASQITTTLPITKTTSYSYNSTSQPTQSAPVQVQQSSFTTNTEKSSTLPVTYAPAPASNYSYQADHHNRREETHREEVSRPVSQLSQYSESRNYKRNYEEKTETTTIPAVSAPITTNHSSSYSTQNLSNATNINDIFDKKKEMNENLPRGSLSNTHNNTAGGYRDQEGHDVSYKRELTTSADPGKEYALLKEEEKRVVETPMEPGVISRHVTTKYYKKKTVTDTTTTTVPDTPAGH